MDPASVVLSEGLDPTRPRTYAALSEDGKVARTTLWYRAHGRPSKEEKAKSQQCLTPSEEKALVKYLLRMSKNSFPIPVKYLPLLAFVIACQRSSVFQAPASDVTIKPPGKNWPRAFQQRHPELKSKRVKALCWNYSCRWVIQALLSDQQYHFYGSVRSVPEALYTGISTVLSVSPVLCNYRASCI
jgi:hypothetical protein